MPAVHLPGVLVRAMRHEVAGSPGIALWNNKHSGPPYAGRMHDNEVALVIATRSCNPNLEVMLLTSGGCLGWVDWWAVRQVEP